MPLHEIELLLKDKMGLHSSTVGSGTIAQSVERRMRSCNIESITDYRNILLHSATELDALIETVVIPETWFFRDTNPFAAFSEWLRTTWLPRETSEPLRVLSVPCSTGEEPYTLAMCLADCGIDLDSAHIDAVDISSTNLENARTAEYGNNSFRGSNLSYRDRHFEAVGQRYRLKEPIRKRVCFQKANILDSSFTTTRASYHVIFCRNLLIYFDRPTQHRALDQLQTLLTGDGLLFLGHSETSLMLERAFTPLEFPRCFAFRRGKAAAAPQQPPVSARTVRRAPTRPQVPAAPDSAGQPFARATAQPLALPAVAQLSDQELLLQAFRLANEGHMDEAAERCETLLRKKSPPAGAHYLLGIIREAAGNTQDAEQLFRKTIYLEPNHYEALTHLSVIYDKKGDTQNARRFRERAARAYARNQIAGLV